MLPRRCRSIDPAAADVLVHLTFALPRPQISVHDPNTTAALQIHFFLSQIMIYFHRIIPVSQLELSTPTPRY